jgi:AraC family transcriptional regulator of adaptative response/methylated-DNA-[protein]-cysteine methyltransferase
MVTAAPALDSRYTQVAHRDAAADGVFWYAVRTTGVFCRPSCASRTPRPENVQFFADTESAIAAGYRACQRCHPLHVRTESDHEALVRAICARVDDAVARGLPTPTLSELADATQYSPFHLQRVFRRALGVTPRAWSAQRRALRLAEELASSASVVHAQYAVGLSSTSQLHKLSTERFGMSASAVRGGGVDEHVVYATTTTSLGALLVAASQRGVCFVALGDDDGSLLRDLRSRFFRADITEGDATFAETVAAVVRSVEAPAMPFALPLDLRGTAFQERVWRALRTIPAGVTLTYRALAERIGQPEAVRAVASACGANPVAVVVPCHRVVRHDGALAGYRWGVERKRALLARERGDPPGRGTQDE